MKPAVICLVESEGEAKRIIAQLRASGFARDQISVLLAGTRARPDIATNLGWLVGLGAIDGEGVGSFLAAGPILASLSAARDDPSAGGLIGVLRTLGISTVVAESYRDDLEAGLILVSVHTDDRRGRALAKRTCEDGGVQGVRLTQ